MKKIILTIILLFITSQNIFAQSMDIYAQVSAKITFIKKVNSSVKKGDILIKLDDSQAKVKLNEVEALANYKKVILDDANENLDQYSELYDSTVSSKRELDLAKLTQAKAELDYEEQKAKVDYYTLELKKYIIKAPFNGKVTKIQNLINVTNIYLPQPLMQLSSTKK